MIRGLERSWWLALALVAGCEESGAVIAADPLEIDFGEVPLGEVAELGITLSNSGESAGTVSLSIVGEGPFGVRLEGAVEVAPGLDREVIVEATPVAEGRAEDVLRLLWGENSTDISLAVTGILAAQDADADGHFRPDDCDDTDANVHPGAEEVCNGTDDDCSGEADDLGDNDGDGASACDDCDDADPNRSPTANEACDDVDNDCDALVDEVFNVDGDDFTTCEDPVDCDDLDPNRYPGAEELCNGLDDNCDSATDEGFDDLDDDGAATCLDCDDNDATQRPGIPEVCDGQDSDCDGAIDDGCPPVDADGDGVATTAGDCDDGNDAIYPGAEQLCDGIFDNDCDGPDANEVDADSDGITLCAVPADCDDNEVLAFPGNTETCDGLDNDCSGDIESIADDDGDGFTPCAGDCDDNEALASPDGVEVCDGIDNDCFAGPDDTSPDLDLDGASQCSDCDDLDPTSFPGGTEVCDAADNDCDGSDDEGFDGDGDGTTTCGVDGVGGNIDDDCNDSEFLVEPGAPELCDGMDTNCDGVVTGESDVDGDGFVGCAGDCVESAAGTWSAEIHPGAAEVCDGWDSNCSTPFSSGNADQPNEVDNDGDGYIDCAALAVGAIPPGSVVGAGDCADSGVIAASGEINPGAAEACDGWDTNCTVPGGGAAADQSDEQDDDGDGYIPCATLAVGITPPAGVLGAGDCVDESIGNEPASAFINPGAAELCDGWDTNCSTPANAGAADVADELDDDGDGYVPCDTSAAIAPLAAGVNAGGDCFDLTGHLWSDDINPGEAEACDGWDTNCSVSGGGALPDLATEMDSDGDGYLSCGPLSAAAVPPVGILGASDCDDGTTGWASEIYPGAAEICDGFDTNCVGGVPSDEVDGDGDDVLPCSGFVSGSSAVTGLLAGDDCDDADADYSPLAAEGCGDPDYDCDTITEDCLSCQDLLVDHPASASGLYDIDPDGSGPSGLVEVYCDMTTNGGGWTLIQRTTNVGPDNLVLRTGYASFYGTSVGSPAGTGVMRLAGQWWDDIAGASAEFMVEHVLSKQIGGSCSPLRYRVANGTLTMPAVGDPSIVVATDPNNVVNASSTGGTRFFSTLDSGPKSAACVVGQNAVPWFFLTDSGCGTTLPTYFGGYYSGGQPRPTVWYSNVGTDLSGNTTATACGGDTIAGPTTNWLADTTMSFFVR